MNETTKEAGKAIEYGLTAFGKKVAGYLFIVWLFMIALYSVTGRFDYDSTDKGRDRSGLSLFVDNMTGCHYLGNEHGGMTPRLDQNGSHICSGHD